MNPPLTYRPKFTSTNIGGYRYFFNGQESDNEVFGENGLFAFEFRMHDARLGRFWSVDPLAAKYPWNSTYAFAENSPIGYLEMEGLEKVQFGKVSVNFSNLNEDQVKLYLKKYRDYHHGNIKAKEIMRTDNDNEYWRVSDISDTYMRSIGTRIVKFNMDKTTTLSDNVRINVGQFITRYGDLEGHHDGSNSGRITREDVIVGLTIVSIMSGVGAMAETGFSAVETFGILNNFDDLIGFFANGKESLLQSITPNKRVINITKTVISGANAGKDIKDIKRNIREENYNSIMNTIMDIFGTGNNLENTISNEKTEKKNNRFIFFVWESALNIFCMGFFIMGFCVALLQLLLGNPKIYEEYFNVIHCILALLSMLTLRVSVIDEEGITIKMLLLPIRKKLLYNQIVFIGYTRAVGSASILVKNNYYSWWKCFLYRIYLPTIKYQGNEKNTFILLSFIKEHYSKEIIPIGHGAEFLCKKVNDYYQENNVD